jgi:hypothetical protein
MYVTLLHKRPAPFQGATQSCYRLLRPEKMLGSPVEPSSTFIVLKDYLQVIEAKVFVVSDVDIMKRCWTRDMRYIDLNHI